MENFGVVQLVLILSPWEPLFSVVGIVVAFFALALGMYHVFEIKQVLSSAKTQLDKLERLERSTSTHYVDEFPKFIPKIIDLINETKDTLLVFCDIPAYGNFTDPHNFKAYRRAIEVFIDRAKENKDFKLELVCLEEKSRLSSYDDVLKEFETWREKSGENLKRFLSERRGFWFDGHSLSEDALVEKRNLIKRDEFKGLLEKANTEMIDGPFSEIDIKEIKGRMPAFFWLSDERNAIFSIPAYKSEHTELGFSTSDKHLINALLAIRDRYVDPTAHDSTASATLSPPE
jgi:sugar-specific transcriptional regulator TrmB